MGDCLYHLMLKQIKMDYIFFSKSKEDKRGFNQIQSSEVNMKNTLAWGIRNLPGTNHLERGKKTQSSYKSAEARKIRNEIPPRYRSLGQGCDDVPQGWQWLVNVFGFIQHRSLCTRLTDLTQKHTGPISSWSSSSASNYKPPPHLWISFKTKQKILYFMCFVRLPKCIELYMWIQSQLLDDEYCLLISSDSFGKHVQQNRKISTENEHWVKTELSGSHKWLQTENNSDCHLRQFPRLLLFSPSILSKRHFRETAGKSFTSNCERRDSSRFQTHCAKRHFKGGGHIAIIVAGRDYLLQDNERLNYKREQSFLRNIKRLPVRSEELSRRNQFLPPPRGKSRTTCTYKTSALCTEQDHQRQFHTERLLSSPRTSFTICINSG